MRPPPLLQLFRGFLPLPFCLSLESSPFAFLRSTRPFFSSLSLFPSFLYFTTYINVHESSVVLCPLLFFFLLLLFDFYSTFPDFFISSMQYPSPPFVLCLAFVRFPLDYSIDPRDFLIILSSRVFSRSLTFRFINFLRILV